MVVRRFIVPRGIVVFPREAWEGRVEGAARGPGLDDGRGATGGDTGQRSLPQNTEQSKDTDTDIKLGYGCCGNVRHLGV